MRPNLNEARASSTPSTRITRDVCSPASRVRAAIFLHEWQKSPKRNQAEEVAASGLAHAVADGIMLSTLPTWRRRLAAEPSTANLAAPATEWALEIFLMSVADFVDRRGEAHGMPEGLRFALVNAVFGAAEKYLTGGAA